MQKTLHLLLGVGISPLHRWNRRSLSSFTRFSKSKSASSCSSSSVLSSSHPHLQFWPLFSKQGGCFRSVQMSAAKGSESHHDADGGSASAAVASPVAHKPDIRFCQTCGGPTKQVIPDGEEKVRAVCTSCGKIHYENPKMVVGCLVEHDDKVLLCKRSIQPSHGLWTLPAGYLEIGESAAEGAIRETLEEACADVEVLSPFAQLDIPRIGQSYIIFRAKLRRPQFSPGPESSECAFFALEDIPFDSLAFSSIFVTLKLYIEDVKAGNVKFHYCTINKRPGASPSDPNGFSVDYHLRC